MSYHTFLQRLAPYGISVALVGSMIVPSFAHAQSARGIVVSPPVGEVTVSPGETVTRQIEVKNSGADALDFTTAINSFGSANEDGGAAFSPFGDVVSWMTVTPSQFKLGPNESKILFVNIKVPQSANAGGYFATVFAISKPPAVKGGSGIGIGQYIGSNLLVNVNGQVREAGSIIEFSTAKASYEQAEPVPFLFRFQNSGNSNLRPVGVIEIFKGGSKVSTVPLNSAQASVLPGSIRKFEAVNDKTLPGGKYTARAVITFAGQTLSSAPVSFVVVGTASMLGIVIVLAACLIVALFFALRPHKMKGMNQK